MFSEFWFGSSTISVIIQQSMMLDEIAFAHKFRQFCLTLNVVYVFTVTDPHHGCIDGSPQWPSTDAAWDEEADIIQDVRRTDEDDERVSGQDDLVGRLHVYRLLLIIIMSMLDCLFRTHVTVVVSCLWPSPCSLLSVTGVYVCDCSLNSS